MKSTQLLLGSQQQAAFMPPTRLPRPSHGCRSPQELALQRVAIALLPQLAAAQLPALQSLALCDAKFHDNNSVVRTLLREHLWGARWLTQLHGLTFDVCLLPADMGAHAEGLLVPHLGAVLPALRSFKVAKGGMRAADASTLAAALPALRELEVDDITSQGLEALVGASWFGGLERLAVTRCRDLSAAVAAAIAAAPLTALTSLCLAGSARASAAALLSPSGAGSHASPACRQLRELRLRHFSLGSHSGAGISGPR